MRLDRRAFVAGMAAMAAVPRRLVAGPEWQAVEVTTRVDLGAGSGAARLWLPLPLAADTPYQRTLESRFESTASRHWRTADPPARLAVQHAAWPEGAGPRTATLTVVVATRDRSEAEPAIDDPRLLAHYRAPTRLLPIDGIVADTARAIIGTTSDDELKARRIYDWIVDHTFRDPAVEGCGLGDIRWMLETKNLGGKCADLNALFVGLCRAAGLAARDVYGLRVGPSRSFRSLGRSGDVTTAQHCRAEVHLPGRGWLPVDPADVRKVVIEERPGEALPLTDPVVMRARAAGYGAWEMNWIAFNDAHDVRLADAAGPALPFFMYPHADVDGLARRGERPERFRYTIAARPVAFPSAR